MATASIEPDFTQINDKRGSSKRGKAAELRLMKILIDMGFEVREATFLENVKDHIDIWVRTRNGWEPWQVKSCSNDPDMPAHLKTKLYSFELFLEDDASLERDWEFPQQFAKFEHILYEDGTCSNAKPGWGMMGKSVRMAFERDEGVFNIIPFNAIQQVAIDKTVLKFALKKNCYTTRQMYRREDMYKNKNGVWYYGWSAITYLNHDDLAPFIERTLPLIA